MGKITISMAMFNSYVKLPDGIGPSQSHFGAENDERSQPRSLRLPTLLLSCRSEKNLKKTRGAGGYADGMRMVPSGKRLHNYGKIHHFYWENQLFRWPFSSSQTISLPEAKSHYIPFNHHRNSWFTHYSDDCFPINPLVWWRLPKQVGLSLDDARVFQTWAEPGVPRSRTAAPLKRRWRMGHDWMWRKPKKMRFMSWQNGWFTMENPIKSSILMENLWFKRIYNGKSD